MPRLCNSVLLAALCLQSILRTAFAASFIPVRRQIPSSSNELLRNRDLATHLKLLHPRSEVDLHYLPEDDGNSMLVTVTATHHHENYVKLEDVDPLIHNVLCSDSTGTISFEFRRAKAYEAAQQLWSRYESLLFITNHRSCNSDVDRAVHKASNLTFDHANLRMTASSRTLLLDESSHASSEITISGTEISGAELRRLERRNASPETTKSTVFDLDTALAAGKDHLVSVRGLDLYCDDCSITGQASPFFRYKINTDIRDCVDKIAALAHEDDSTLSGILQGIGQDIETGVDCIGDALAAVEHGLAHDVVDLVKGNPDKELPVLHWIVPEAIVGIEASETIDASLNFEMSAIEGIDLKCSFPGGIGSNCAVSAISALFRPGSSKQPGDLSFTLGTWELGLSFAYGLTVEAKATVDVDVKLPVTAEIGQGQSAELDLMSPAWHNTIHPKLKSGPLSVSATDPELCLSVALGPSIKASLGSKKLAKLSKIEATARLDLPRIQSCFKPAHDVDAQCKPGTIQDAVELDTTAGFGLDVELTTVLTHSGNLAAPLYKSVNLYKHCFNLDSSDPLQGLNGSSSSSGSSKGMNPSIPLPHYPPSYTGSPALNGTNPPSPTGSGISSPSSTGSPGSGGNYTSSYNCAGVGPSPGGQPCAYMGGGPVTCESLYTWSCPNGDSGAVPADTICACGAFRHPGWQPPAVAKPACTSGIYCYDEQTFGVCGPAGIESPQLVAPGTMCIGGAITYAY